MDDLHATPWGPCRLGPRHGEHIHGRELFTETASTHVMCYVCRSCSFALAQLAARRPTPHAPFHGCGWGGRGGAGGGGGAAAGPSLCSEARNPETPLRCRTKEPEPPRSSAIGLSFVCRGSGAQEWGAASHLPSACDPHSERQPGPEAFRQRGIITLATDATKGAIKARNQCGT